MDALQLTRHLFVGVLLVATIHFGRMTRRSPDDALPRLATVFLLHALAMMAMRTALHARLPLLETALATRLSCTAAACGATMLALVVMRGVRKRLVWAALAGVLSLVWIDGGAFTSELTRVVTPRGEVHHALAPGPLWLLFVAGLEALLLHAGWRGFHATRDSSRRRLTVLCTLAAMAAFGWDAALDAGYVSGMPTTGWAIGTIMVVVSVVTFRRMRRAHGDLILRLDAEREQLERDRAALARSEHLGALGALSDGLRHELANPLEAITLNLAWLRKTLREGGRSAERNAPAMECLMSARLIAADIDCAMRDFAAAASGPTSAVSCRAPESDRQTISKVALRVLVVDDDVLVARALERALVDFEVTAVASGDEALRALLHDTFDAVLCDVMMPTMSGRELYRRAIARHPELAQRFIFLTGGTFGGGEDAALPGPVLNKPVDGEAITRAVRAHVTAAELAAVRGSA